MFFLELKCTLQNPHLTLSLSMLFTCACCSRVLSLCNRYLAKISVYDNVVKATFVLLGNTGPELTGRQALELIDNYFEVTHTHLIFHLPNNLN